MLLFTVIDDSSLTSNDVPSSVTLEQCRSEGAMILFTVMDHDVLTFNDFAGEAYLSLNQVSITWVLGRLGVM